jgi:hypothetical protein
MSTSTEKLVAKGRWLDTNADPGSVAICGGHVDSLDRLITMVHTAPGSILTFDLVYPRRSRRFRDCMSKGLKSSQSASEHGGAGGTGRLSLAHVSAEPGNPSRGKRDGHSDRRGGMRPLPSRRLAR